MPRDNIKLVNYITTTLCNSQVWHSVFIAERGNWIHRWSHLGQSAMWMWSSHVMFQSLTDIVTSKVCVLSFTILVTCMFWPVQPLQGDCFEYYAEVLKFWHVYKCVVTNLVSTKSYNKKFKKKFSGAWTNVHVALFFIKMCFYIFRWM